MSKRAGKEPAKKSASAKGPRRHSENKSKSPRRRHGEEHDAIVSGHSHGRREDVVGEKKDVSDALDTQYKELTFKYMDNMKDMNGVENGPAFVEGLLFPAVRLYAQGK